MKSSVGVIVNVLTFFRLAECCRGVLASRRLVDSLSRTVSTFRYVVGVLLVVGLPPGMAWWFLVHPFVGFWRRLGARSTMAVMILFFLASVLGLLMVRDMLLGPDLGFSWPLFAAGVVLCLLAGWMGWKRKRYLTLRILAGVPEVEADEDERGKLLNEGPYARIRHPRYVEIAVATFGYAALANYLGCWILAVLTLPVLHGIVLLEERELCDRFGDAYRDYVRRVPRYFPKR